MKCKNTCFFLKLYVVVAVILEKSFDFVVDFLQWFTDTKMMFFLLMFDYQRFSIDFCSMGNWQCKNNVSKIKQKTNRKPWIGWFQRMRHDSKCSTENLAQLTIFSIISDATFEMISIVILLVFDFVVFDFGVQHCFAHKIYIHSKSISFRAGDPKSTNSNALNGKFECKYECQCWMPDPQNNS